jgi:hypothetical protein
LTGSALAASAPRGASTVVAPTRITLASISPQLSAETKQVLTDLKLKDDSVQSALQHVSRQIDDLQSADGGEVETETETVQFVLGVELTARASMLPRGFIVKARVVGANQIDLYLTYFYRRPNDRLAKISGSIKADGASIPIQPQQFRRVHPRLQSFKLTEQPIPSFEAEIALSFRRANDEAPTPLEPFEIFDVIPYFGVAPFGEQDAGVGVQPPPLFGIHKIGVIDYRRVEQELSCYVMGAISQIENTQQGEYKEKITRSLTIQEEETEVTEESSAERQSDTEVAEKLEMQSEVSSVLSEETSRSFNAGTGVSAMVGPVEMSANVGFTFNSSSSRQQSNSEAIQFAKNVTNKVQEKILQKRTSRRRSLMRKEFENTNKHGLDNRGGTGHVVGVSRWVDKIYNNILVNYGRRFVIEWEIPEPAKNFIAVKSAEVEEDGPNLTKPRSPRSLGLRGASDLSRSNYLRFASRYKADVPPPPVDNVNLTRAFSHGDSSTVAEPADVNMNHLYHSAAYSEIEVPKGYIATSAVAYSTSYLWSETVPLGPGVLPKNTASVWVSIAGGAFRGLPSSEDEQEEEIPLDNVSDFVSVGILAGQAEAYAVSLRVHCELTNAAFNAWRLEAYDAIIDAYEKKRAAYEAAVAQYESEKQTTNLNPRFQKNAMEQELQRVCIEMMTRPFNVNVSMNHYEEADEFGLSQLRLSPALDKHAAVVLLLTGVRVAADGLCVLSLFLWRQNDVGGETCASRLWERAISVFPHIRHGADSSSNPAWLREGGDVLSRNRSGLVRRRLRPRCQERPLRLHRGRAEYGVPGSHH